MRKASFVLACSRSHRAGIRTCFSGRSIDGDARGPSADAVDGQDDELVLGEGRQAPDVVEGRDGAGDLLVVPGSQPRFVLKVIRMLEPCDECLHLDKSSHRSLKIKPTLEATKCFLKIVWLKC